MTFLPFLLNPSRIPICSCKFLFFWPVPLKSVKKRKKKYLCMYIDKQNQLKKKKSIYACVLIYKISKKKKKLFFFSICAVNTQKPYWLIYSRSQHQTRLANDFPVFLLNRSKLPICSYYFFLFWPLPLQTLNGSSTVLVSISQVSPDPK